MSDAPSRRSIPWPDQLEMTAERAELIRKWRCEDKQTWRGVAHLASEEWDGGWDSNQIAGMELCEYAAAHLGQHYMEPPWNW